MCDYSKKPEKWMVPKYFEGYVSASRKAYNRAARKLFKQLADDDLNMAYQLEHLLNGGTLRYVTLNLIQSYFEHNEVQGKRFAKIAPEHVKNQIFESSEARELFKQLTEDDLDLAYKLELYLNYERIGEGTLYELQTYFYQDAVQADRLAAIMQTYDNEILMPTIGVDCNLDRYYYCFDM